MKSSARSVNPEVNSPQADTDFAQRLSDRLKGRVASQVARDIGVAPSTLQRYLGGSIPAADTAIKLARALDVGVEWLIEGVEEPQRPFESDTDSVRLPRYDVHTFGEFGKGPPAEVVTVPRFLLEGFKTTTGLWLASMPSDALPEVAREGETIVCRDPDEVLQERRVYIYLFDGRPIVRRLFIRPEGFLLKAQLEEETIAVGRHDVEERLVPIGRVLSALRSQQV